MSAFGLFDASSSGTADLNHHQPQQRSGYLRQSTAFSQQHHLQPMTNVAPNCSVEQPLTISVDQQQMTHSLAHSTIASTSTAPLLQMPVDFTNIMMLDSSTNLLDSSSVIIIR
jgi:hypothetical protein